MQNSGVCDARTEEQSAAFILHFIVNELERVRESECHPSARRRRKDTIFNSVK